MAQDRKEDKTLLWLYKNDKSSDKQPDFTGPGRIHHDVLKELVEAYKKYGDDGNLKLRAASWEKEGKNGPYQFITIEVDIPKEQESQKEDDSIPF
tara:strand:- start:1233 stop:1517 length:285 start_codon:yes stop_codon:yes gene_type:complete